MRNREFFKKILITFSVLLVNLYFVLGQGVIHCPPNITISCCQDYNNIDLTGNPATCNLHFNYFNYQDSIGINECRVGVIKRTWTGYNNVGHYSCNQYITMVRNNVFSGNINWPKDWSGSCGDQIPYSEPIYDVGLCDQIAYTFHDDTLRFGEEACTKILRKWIVIDWCTYKPNNGSNAGKYEHTQILMITDNIAPRIASCENKVLPALNFNCTGDINISKSAADENCGVESPLKWVCEIDYGNDWSIDTTIYFHNQIADLNLLNIPIGQHKIIWKVYDPCANVSSCMEIIELKDKKAPTIIANSSTVIALSSVGDSVKLNAKCFIMCSSSDNCTPANKIVYSFSPDPKDSVKVFKCSDVGIQFVRLYAIDLSGNYDFVNILIRIEINSNCNQNIVNGIITELNSLPKAGIHIMLEGHNKKYQIGITNADGKFAIPIKQNNDISLSFIPDYQSKIGINEDDIFAIRDYLLGIKQFNTIEFLAADMNNDGKINMKDMSILKDFINGKISLVGNGYNFYETNSIETGNPIKITNIKDFSLPLKLVCVAKGDIIK